LLTDFGEDRIGILSAAKPDFYKRLGWWFWSGPITRHDQDSTEPIMVHIGQTMGELAQHLPLYVLSREEISQS
jgi:hypothetical protein